MREAGYTESTALLIQLTFDRATFSFLRRRQAGRGKKKVSGNEEVDQFIFFPLLAEIEGQVKGFCDFGALRNPHKRERVRASPERRQRLRISSGDRVACASS